MSHDEIIELWAQANKLVGIRHSRTFDELKEFAELVEEKTKDRVWGNCNREWVKMSKVLLINEREAIAMMVEPLDQSLADEIRARNQK
jgi:hypothetical protein